MKLSEKILLGVLLGAVFTFSPGGFLVAALFLTALCMIKKYIKTESTTFLIKLFIVGFALRAVLAFANYQVALNVMHKGVDTQPDAVVYNNNAYYIAHLLKNFDYSEDVAKDPVLGLSMESERAWLKDEIPPIGFYQHGFYVHMLGYVYAYLGYCPLAMKILNCLFGALCAILVYLIARLLSGSENISKTSATVTMFFPSMIYWSATLLRDTIATSIFLAYMLALLIYITSGGRKALISALVSVIVLSLFKEKVSPILMMGLVFVLIANAAKKIFKMKRLTVFIVTICIFAGSAALLLLNKDIMLRQLNKNATTMFSHHKSYSLNNTASVYKVFSESIYAKTEWHLQDFLNVHLPFSIFKSLAYFFLSPFPWYIPYHHLGLLVFYPQVILTFIFLPFVLLGLLVSARRDVYVTVVIVTVLALLVIPNAIAEGIIGIVVRHRDMFMPFLIIFASCGFLSTMRKNIT